MNFIVESSSFFLTKEEYSLSGLLRPLAELVTTDSLDFNLVSVTDFRIVYDYLTKQVLPSTESFHLFDFFDISPVSSYGLACLFELDMRANMYVQPDHRYLAPYYGLQKLDQEVWEKIKFERANTPDMLFKEAEAEKASWESIQWCLQELAPLLEVEGVFLAGGAIYSILFGLEISDIDLFLYACNEQEAEAKIHQIVENLRKYDFLHRHLHGKHRGPFWKSHKHNKRCCHKIQVIRTANAITICTEPNIQIILRLYQIPSEILHGFDVSSCCLGYSKDGLWMTHRCWFALEHGYNLVDFDRLSPSYEYRLAKYGSRGMRVKIPDFDCARVNEEVLRMDFEKHKADLGSYENINYEKRLSYLCRCKGLDILLALDYRCRAYNYGAFSLRTLKVLADEHSDYNGRSHLIKCATGSGTGKSFVSDVLAYLYASHWRYPEHAAKYMPFLAVLEGIPSLSVLEEIIENIPTDCSIWSYIGEAFRGLGLCIEKEASGTRDSFALQSDNEEISFTEESTDSTDDNSSIKEQSSLSDSEEQLSIDLEDSVPLREDCLQSNYEGDCGSLVSDKENSSENEEESNESSYRKPLSAEEVARRKKSFHWQLLMTKIFSTHYSTFAASYPFFQFQCSSIPRCNKLEFYACPLKQLPLLLHLPGNIHSIMSSVRRCDFGPDLTWKTQNPGEQMTNTFHQIVLLDQKVWYEGKYYQ